MSALSTGRTGRTGRIVVGVVLGVVSALVFSASAFAAGAPVVQAGSENVSMVTPTGVTLEAQVEPNEEETNYAFDYAESEAKLASEPTVIPGESTLNGIGYQLASVTISGPEPGKTYYYKVIAENEASRTAGKPVEGPIQSFTRTLPRVNDTPPVVSEPTQHTVLVAATIDPEIEAPLEATYRVFYGESETYSAASAEATAGSGFTDLKTSPVLLSGLSPGTIYHYAIIATSVLGSTTGPDYTFTTPAEPVPTTPPMIGSESAQFVNENSAVIESEINPEGLETTYEIQYGTSTGYGSSAPDVTAIAPFTSAQGTIVSLVDLSPGTTYHYRIVATNHAGTTHGQDQTFTTPGATPTTGFTSFTIPSVPLIGATPLTFPTDKEPVAKSTPKSLTNKQKLANALKGCAKKPRRQRSKCVKRAHKHYGSTGKSASAKKVEKRV